MRGIVGEAYTLPANPEPEELRRYLATLRCLRDELRFGFDTVVYTDVD